MSMRAEPTRYFWVTFVVGYESSIGHGEREIVCDINAHTYSEAITAARKMLTMRERERVLMHSIEERDPTLATVYVESAPGEPTTAEAWAVRREIDARLALRETAHSEWLSTHTERHGDM